MKLSHLGSVGSEGLVHPGTQLGDAGVDAGHAGAAGRTSPGHNADQSPGSALLTDQRTARVALNTTNTDMRKVVLLPVITPPIHVRLHPIHVRLHPPPARLHPPYVRLHPPHKTRPHDLLK